MRPRAIGAEDVHLVVLDHRDGIRVEVESSPVPRLSIWREVSYAHILRVIDDGQGFDVSKITNIEESGRGRGVFSMKERVGLFGGVCSIESQPGQGTTVWARVPIHWDGDDAENKGIGG